jgi:transcriptional regulator with XRE-family HTH domain
MSFEQPAPGAWGRNFKAALRPIRIARGISVAQMARLMGMDRRSYGNFEAGRGKVSVEKVFEFAALTDSDPWSILAAVSMDAPGLAANAAGNKLTKVFLIALRDFERTTGQAMRLVHPGEAFTAFQEAFQQLASLAETRKALAAPDWLKSGSSPPDNGEED